MTIALTAPTGKVGTALLTEASQRQIPIRALVRDAKRLRVAANAAVSFDFADRTTYARALEGVRTLVLISPPFPGQADAESAVVDAARAAGVAHVIKLSGMAANDAASLFGEELRAVEAHIRASGLAWTLVRPTFFMENLLTLAAPIASGTYPAPTADARMTQIAVADIAAVLLTVATEPDRHRGAIYTLTGPTADRGDEIAIRLSEAIGHGIRFVDVPEDAFRQNLLRVGADAWHAEGVVKAYRNVRAGGAMEITDDVRRVTGRAPIDFAAWAQRHSAMLRSQR